MSIKGLKLAKYKGKVTYVLQDSARVKTISDDLVPNDEISTEELSAINGLNDGSFIDIIVFVLYICQMVSIVTEDGKNLTSREIQVVDEFGTVETINLMNEVSQISTVREKTFMLMKSISVTETRTIGK